MNLNFFENKVKCGDEQFWNFSMICIRTLLNLGKEMDVHSFYCLQCYSHAEFWRTVSFTGYLQELVTGNLQRKLRTVNTVVDYFYSVIMCEVKSSRSSCSDFFIVVLKYDSFGLYVQL